MYVSCCAALELIRGIPDGTVSLFCFDPPYGNVIGEAWDNFRSDEVYADWIERHIECMVSKLDPRGSVVFFGAIGKHGDHPFWKTVIRAERHLCFRNVITWGKRRGYGKSHDYLYCREEIAWFSKSSERTSVRFNVPYTDELRGYAGFNKRYPAKSPYKRVSNVWSDIPELMRPRRVAEKPLALMERLVMTHSDPGDLVVDPFAGLGTTGVAALSSGRRFLGCDTDPAAVTIAENVCLGIMGE